MKKQFFNIAEIYKSYKTAFKFQMHDLLNAFKTRSFRLFHVFQLLYLLLATGVLILIFSPLLSLPFPILAAMMVLAFPFGVYSTLFCVFLWQITSNAYWFSDEFNYFFLITVSWFLMALTGYFQWFVWGNNHKRAVFLILFLDLLFAAYLIYRLMNFTFRYQ